MAQLLIRPATPFKGLDRDPIIWVGPEAQILGIDQNYLFKVPAEVVLNLDKVI